MIPSMRFFTPDRYRAAQRDLEQMEVEWRSSLEAYWAEVASIKPAFPSGLRRLVEEHEFHDARLALVDPGGTTLSLLLHVPGPTLRGEADEKVRVRYEGVLDVAALDLGTVEAASSNPVDMRALMECDWLYDEVRQVDGAFEHHVMLWRAGRLALFGVCFTGLDCEVVQAG